MTKPRRFTKLWRPQSLPGFSKRLTANFWPIKPRKTDHNDLDMPQSEAEEPHEAHPQPTLDADYVWTTPNADEDAEAGDDVDTDHDHDAEEAAQSVPSSSTQEKHDSVRGGARPPNISRKPSTKKDEEILDWMDRQPKTLHLSSHDADQAPEFPPSRSDSGDISNAGKEREPQPIEFAQSSPPSPLNPFHLPRLRRARAASQDPKTRGKSEFIHLRTDPGVLIRNSASRIATRSVLGIASGNIRVNLVHCRPALSIEERLGDDHQHRRLQDLRRHKHQEMVSLYNINYTDAGGELRDVARAVQTTPSTRLSSGFFPTKAHPLC